MQRKSNRSSAGQSSPFHPNGRLPSKWKGPEFTAVRFSLEGTVRPGPIQLSLFHSPFDCSIYYRIQLENATVRVGEKKNLSNFKKHGVWFEEAQTVWADSESVEFFDPEHSSNEDRFIRIGHSTRGRILLVVFCERSEGSTIRIISARKTTTREMRAYEKGI